MLERTSIARALVALRATGGLCWLGILAFALPCVPTRAAAADLTRPLGNVIVPPQTAFGFVGRYATGLSGTSAETVALWGTTMYVSNATAAAVDVVDVTNPAAPSLVRRVDLSSFGAEVTSVATSPDFVAAAVVADPRTGPGTVVLLDHDGTVVATAAAGAGPDALAFTPDGKRIVVANEGEPNSYGQPDSVDPEGSVSLVTVPPGLANSSRKKLARLPSRLIDFRAFNVGSRRNDELPAGVRIFGPGATVAQDLEPEYVAVTPDGRHGLCHAAGEQRDCVLDLPSGRIEKIVALGLKDHGVSGPRPERPRQRRTTGRSTSALGRVLRHVPARPGRGLHRRRQDLSVDRQRG